MDAPLLRCKNVKKYFPVRSGVFLKVSNYLRAVDGVSFEIPAGRTLGVVGESGCGKSTLGRLVLRLYDLSDGEIFFRSQNITEISRSEMRHLRRDMQIIFQDPYASLNPRYSIASTLMEPLKIHGVGKNKLERRDRVAHVLEKVGLRPDVLDRYPHEFSGGQRQRIVIARALILNPKLVVADEPVSALDVSIQSQIINLMKDLQDEFGLTYLFIAHNLAVVAHVSDEIAVMYLGRIVERAVNRRIFSMPKHPYTQALISAIPVPDPTVKKQRMILKGDVPSPMNPPMGCAFHTRCPWADLQCRQEQPVLRNVGADETPHWVACHKA